MYSLFNDSNSYLLQHYLGFTSTRWSIFYGNGSQLFVGFRAKFLQSALVHGMCVISVV